MADPSLRVRRAGTDDVEEIVALAGRALGWPAGEPHEALFRWKHLDNPAGASPTWVAIDERGAVIGVRTFLRWRFRLDGDPLAAVRAVDTATAPEHQGRGIFRRLTMHGIEELAAEGVSMVFNTPNDQSRPGYLSMGWEVVGRVPIATRPASLGALVRMAAARVPAAKWSMPCRAGVTVPELDDATLDSLASHVRGAGLVTDRTPAHLRWRYGFEPLHYRAIAAGRDLHEGCAVVRTRSRGSAIEAAVCEVLAPTPAARRAVLRAVRRATGADYLVVAGGGVGDGLIPLPRQGPVLTWRAVARSTRPPLASWHLQLGDVELL